MATRNEVTTKKLKTGQTVTIDKYTHALMEEGRLILVESRKQARELKDAGLFMTYRIVRLNPITGVVSK